MQAAQLKLGSDIAVLGTRQEEARHSRALATEMVLEIPTIHFADVGFAVASEDAAQPRERDELVARVLNVVIAVVGLVLLAPLIGLAALAIRLSPRGPVLYSQIRVGVDRRWRLRAASTAARTTMAASCSRCTSSDVHEEWLLEPDGRGWKGIRYALPPIPQHLFKHRSSECSANEYRRSMPRNFRRTEEDHTRISAAPARKAGHHWVGTGKPSLRLLHRRCTLQGPVRPRIRAPTGRG